MNHPRNTAGCCDGRGQVHHGEGALAFVTLCPNGCGAKAWDEECERADLLADLAGPLVTGGCPATREAVEEQEERGEIGCPLCSCQPEAHRSEREGPPSVL
jgi:hypothetical protein